MTPRRSRQLWGKSRRAAVNGLMSAGFRVPGHLQNEDARVPPSQAVAFWPRIPALKTFVPTVPPLSFMKMTSVSRSIPHSVNFASSQPTLLSILAIMPKNLATSALGTFPVYRTLSSGRTSSGECGAFVAM